MKHHLAFMASAGLLALGLGATSGATGVKAAKRVLQCGAKFNCLMKAAQSCRASRGLIPSRSNDEQRLVDLRFNYVVTIKEKADAGCLWEYTAGNYRLKFTRKGIAEFKKQGLTTAQIKSEERRNNAAISVPPVWKCTAETTAGLVETIKQFRRGSLDCEASATLDPESGTSTSQSSCDYPPGVTCVDQTE